MSDEVNDLIRLSKELKQWEYIPVVMKLRLNYFYMKLMEFERIEWDQKIIKEFILEEVKAYLFHVSCIKMLQNSVK